MGVPIMVQQKRIQLGTMRLWVRSLALLSGLRIWPGAAVSYSVACRCGSDPELPWLWCRPAAIALIQPLAWELLYGVSVALKSRKQIKNKTAKVAVANT